MKFKISNVQGEVEKIVYVYFDPFDLKVSKLRGRGGLWSKIIQLLPQFIRKNFATFGSRLGKRWDSLNREYEKRKGRLFGWHILIRTGAMFNAATVLNAPGNYIYWTPYGKGENTEMVYGIDSDYFLKDKWSYPVLHQTGTRKMPQRIFMGLTKEDYEELARLIIQHFKIGTPIET